MKIKNDNTVGEAKDFLKDNYKKGVKCPCCDHYVKQWDKPLIGTAVADLIRLVRLYKLNGKALHIHTFTIQRSNFYTLSYWGLIEKGEVEIDNKKRSSGYWQPTDKGIRFVEGVISIPSKAQTYNNKVIGFSADKLYVKEALGEKFDYAKLIKGY